MNIIEQINQAHMAEMMVGKTMPDFNPGDTVKVFVKVKEGDKSRPHGRDDGRQNHA